jgi:hypothetical protein
MEKPQELIDTEERIRLLQDSTDAFRQATDLIKRIIENKRKLDELAGTKPPGNIHSA